ncbi:MAG: hypothetical protein V7K32_01850 [Nostoc sp.]
MAIYVVDLTIFFHLWEIYAYYTMKCGKSVGCMPIIFSCFKGGDRLIIFSHCRGDRSLNNERI